MRAGVQVPHKSTAGRAQRQVVELVQPFRPVPRPRALQQDAAPGQPGIPANALVPCRSPAGEYLQAAGCGGFGALEFARCQVQLRQLDLRLADPRIERHRLL